MSDYLLAHDVGTTGNKATLFDAEGRLVAAAAAPYATRYPRPGWAEQNPEEWWRAVCASTRRLVAQNPEAPARIAAVGFSAMMNGCVPVTDEGRVVRPALIHADIRSRAQCERIAGEIGAQRAYEISGNRLAPYFTLGKLAWLAENEPKSLRAARWCLQAKDFLAGRLTGVFGLTDPSDASLTGLCDIRRCRWSEELVEAGRFDARLLPDIVPSTTVVGRVTAEAAAKTGLRAGTPVVLGGGDGAGATVGAGALSPGEAYHYLGGTSWIATVAPEYTPDPQARVSTLCSLVPGQYVNYGTVQSAGSSIEWFLQTVGVGQSAADRYMAMEALAAGSPPGARGLFFLPYLQGERAPIWNTDARGVFFGLSSAHTRADLARAVYEGVAFALGGILDIFGELGLAPEQVRVLGGGMRCALWRQVFAAVYARPLLVMERLSEATACGAAVAAGVGVGVLQDWEAGRLFAPAAQTETPDRRWAVLYARAKPFFGSLYPALAERFSALADLAMDNGAA
jgi:xylulokinase